MGATTPCGERIMRGVRAVATALAVLVSGTYGSGAQTVKGEMGFLRNDKVLTWQTLNRGKRVPLRNITIDLDSKLSSTLNMATGSGQKDRWYDSVYNEAVIGYKPYNTMGFDFVAREDWNRDTLSKFGQSLLTTTAEGRVNYRPHRWADLTATVGQIYDRRFENEDRGTNISGKAVLEGNPWRNLGTSLDIDGNTSNLERANDTVSVRSEITYDHNTAKLRMGLEDSRRTRGYLSDIDRKSIEERTRLERTVFLAMTGGDFLNYDHTAAYEVSMALGSKQVDDTANDNAKSSKYKNNSEGAVRDVTVRAARGLFGFVTASLEAGYLYDKNHVERPDRSRTQTDVSTQGKFDFGLSRRDSLTVIAMIKRTRIDTPAGVPNDRDELKYEGGVQYIRQIYDYLQTGLDFRLLETHYVNIDATQSSQNKWLKTYQLSPSLEYTPSRSLSVSHSVNLYANLMDYDFDSETNPRSTITRRVTSETRANAAVSSRTRVVLGFMLEQNDYGNLDREGKKLPVEEGLRRYGDIAVEYRFADWITVSPQYIYAIRRDDDVATSGIIRREIDQTYGLNFSLFQTRTGDYRMEINMKRIIRETEKDPVRIRDYVTMVMRYEF